MVSVRPTPFHADRKLLETEIDFVFMEVIIDPRSSYAYGSFYINGLLQQYGEKKHTLFPLSVSRVRWPR